MYYCTNYQSPVGEITLASDEKHLAGLWLENQKYFGGSIPEEMHRDDTRSIFTDTRKWLDRYFAGKKPLPGELPLRPVGSEFRQMVWKLLCEIPYGEVITYGELAQKIAAQMGRDTMSSQAVGGAVGHNPISIIIPCHRVVGAGGSLTGYAGGVNVKWKLLEHEGVPMDRLFIPKKGRA